MWTLMWMFGSITYSPVIFVASFIPSDKYCVSNGMSATKCFLISVLFLIDSHRSIKTVNSNILIPFDFARIHQDPGRLFVDGLVPYLDTIEIEWIHGTIRGLINLFHTGQHVPKVQNEIITIRELQQFVIQDDGQFCGSI